MGLSHRPCHHAPARYANRLRDPGAQSASHLSLDWIISQKWLEIHPGWPTGLPTGSRPLQGLLLIGNGGTGTPDGTGPGRIRAEAGHVVQVQLRHQIAEAATLILSGPSARSIRVATAQDSCINCCCCSGAR